MMHGTYHIKIVLITRYECFFFFKLIWCYGGDLGVDGWIILGWISRRWDVGMWTGLGWHRIGTGGGRL